MNHLDPTGEMRRLLGPTAHDLAKEYSARTSIDPQTLHDLSAFTAMKRELERTVGRGALLDRAVTHGMDSLAQMSRDMSSQADQTKSWLDSLAPRELFADHFRDSVLYHDLLSGHPSRFDELVSATVRLHAMRAAAVESAASSVHRPLDSFWGSGGLDQVQALLSAVDDRAVQGLLGVAHADAWLTAAPSVDVYNTSVWSGLVDAPEATDRPPDPVTVEAANRRQISRVLAAFEVRLRQRVREHLCRTVGRDWEVQLAHTEPLQGWSKALKKRQAAPRLPDLAPTDVLDVTDTRALLDFALGHAGPMVGFVGSGMCTDAEREIWISACCEGRNAIAHHRGVFQPRSTVYVLTAVAQLAIVVGVELVDVLPEVRLFPRDEE